MSTASASVPNQRTLIVARMNPDDAGAVAEVFADSDAGELPRLVNVVRRDLFHFHGLYFHLVETRSDIGDTLPPVRDHPLFIDVNSRLEKYVTAYDPQTWRGPRDAMARGFYTWVADQSGP